MGQFYGEISVIFFLSFRLKTAFSLPFGVFVSTSREREECFFSRGADAFLKKFLLLFFLVVVASTFFSQKENKQSSFYKFCFFVCLLLFFFRSFHTRETCVLRRKVIPHIVII